MRIVLIIVAVAAIGVCLVGIRRGEISARHEIQQLQLRHVSLRRQLWDQQVTLGRLTSPRSVGKRASEMMLGLFDDAWIDDTVAMRD